MKATATIPALTAGLFDAIALAKAAVSLLDDLDHQDEAGRLAGLVEVRRVLRVQQASLMQSVNGFEYLA